MTGRGDEDIASRNVVLAANEDAAHFYRDQLLASTSSGPRDYLTARGFGTLLDETRGPSAMRRQAGRASSST